MIVNNPFRIYGNGRNILDFIITTIYRMPFKLPISNQFIIGMNFYIPDIHHGSDGYDSYVDSTIRDQYMDCIRVDGKGNIFDFVKYDSLFETITAAKDKILVATDRLKSPIQLVPLYREKYLDYLQRNADQAVRTVIEFDDLSGLNILAKLGVFTGKNIDEVIELANSAKKPESLSFLMNYKNFSIGISETDYEL